MCVHPTTATKQRLELELAEAVQEDHESTGSGDAASSRGEGEEVGSGSDSEGEERGRGTASLPPGTDMQNSLEMSMWSLDVSLPSGIDSSIYETEVSVCTSLLICTNVQDCHKGCWGTPPG